MKRTKPGNEARDIRRVLNEQPERVKFSTLVGRLVISLVLVLGITYGVLLAGSRMEGFRALATERLVQWLGLPCTLENARLDMRLRLHLEGLAAPVRGSDAGLWVESVEIRWSLLSWVQGHGPVGSVDVDGVRLVLVQDAPGQWLPRNPSTVWAHLSRLTGIGGVPVGSPADPLLLNQGLHVPFALRNVDMDCWNARAERTAYARGMTLQITPLRTPLQDITHWSVQGVDLAGPAGRAALPAAFIVAGSHAIAIPVTGRGTQP